MRRWRFITEQSIFLISNDQAMVWTPRSFRDTLSRFARDCEYHTFCKDGPHDRAHGIGHSVVHGGLRVCCGAHDVFGGCNESEDSILRIR